MDLLYMRNETWISMELESSDRNWTIGLPKGGKDWWKLDRKFLYWVSVADAKSSECVSAVKIKTVLVKSNNFFSIFVQLTRPD